MEPAEWEESDCRATWRWRNCEARRSPAHQETKHTAAAVSAADWLNKRPTRIVHPPLGTRSPSPGARLPGRHLQRERRGYSGARVEDAERRVKLEKLPGSECSNALEPQAAQGLSLRREA
ncbi:hypothetical protein NDU88_005049 [Pleurodeles waltl]|uniref:Uncharacterized protein n=1 Tax=Pleurodeles waltl TaxID=8319 RepID=A0AAV7QEG8_PLEWA|nr:hypothetical protein NDU88_005049 [Pleurodeles waltl]